MLELIMSGEETASTSENKCCTFFKPRTQRGNARRRKASSDESDVEEHTVKRVERKKQNGIIQGKSSASKKGKLGNEMIGVAFASSKLKTGSDDQGATATIEIDTELDKDARSIFERAQKINEELKGKEDDKVYRGINNYTQYITKRDSAAGSAAKTKAKGPLRAPTNIRSTVRWDYQPDICKDFKETGFCTFGDSCIFMHDRSDYKHGWQMDREWDEKQKNLARNGGEDDDDHKYEIPSDEEDLPFACFICREDFVSPVTTKCGHFFCEKCALANFKKSNRCYVCGKPTGGVFNPAKELEAKLTQRKEQEAEGRPVEDAEAEDNKLIPVESDDENADNIESCDDKRSP